MLIGELADKTGFSMDTIRFYTKSNEQQHRWMASLF